MGGRNEQESEREREHRLQQTDKKQLRSPDTVRGLWPTCTGTEHTDRDRKTQESTPAVIGQVAMTLMLMTLMTARESFLWHGAMIQSSQ